MAGSDSVNTALEELHKQEQALDHLEQTTKYPEILGGYIAGAKAILRAWRSSMGAAR